MLILSIHVKVLRYEVEEELLLMPSRAMYYLYVYVKCFTKSSILSAIKILYCSEATHG